jgi:hypothetical protein
MPQKPRLQGLERLASSSSRTPHAFFDVEDEDPAVRGMDLFAFHYRDDRTS